MEWVNAENVIAVGTFAVASSIAFGQWWYERMVPRRRRIGYRVQLDTAIGDDDGTGGGNTRLGLFDEADGMDEASVVLLRIENDGALSVSIGDYTSGGLHGMTATFDGREVHGVAVTVGPGSGALMSHFTPGARPGVQRLQPAHPARPAQQGRVLQAAGAAQRRHRRLQGHRQRRRPGRRRAPQRVADPGREAPGVQPSRPADLDGVPGRHRAAGGADRHRRRTAAAHGVRDGEPGGDGLDGVRPGRRGAGRGVHGAVPRLTDHGGGAREYDRPAGTGRARDGGEGRRPGPRGPLGRARSRRSGDRGRGPGRR